MFRTIIQINPLSNFLIIFFTFRLSNLMCMYKKEKTRPHFFKVGHLVQSEAANYFFCPTVNDNRFIQCKTKTETPYGLRGIVRLLGISYKKNPT